MKIVGAAFAAAACMTALPASASIVFRGEIPIEGTITLNDLSPANRFLFRVTAAAPISLEWFAPFNQYEYIQHPDGTLEFENDIESYLGGSARNVTSYTTSFTPTTRWYLGNGDIRLEYWEVGRITLQVSGSAGTPFQVFLASVPGGVPEPATWAMMIAGFGAVGGMIRRRRGQLQPA